MEELTRAIIELIGPEGDHNWLTQLNFTETAKASNPVLLSVQDINPDPYFAFTLFILSEIVLAFVGFYLGAAVQANDWHVNHWDWRKESTAVAAAGGGVDGALTPHGIYYSAEAIGFEPTFVLMCGGAYLGSAAANNHWDIKKWNLSSPRTINGAFVGIQQVVWLVDGITYIRVFTKKAGLRGMTENIFIAGTYFTGALVSYYYIAEDFGSVYDAKHWDVTSPIFWFGIVRGYSSGSKLPVGFAEIGIDLVDAKKRSYGATDDRDPTEVFIQNFVVNKKWKVLGAIWFLWVSTSVENETFKPEKWDVSTFGTLLAMANGIVWGKDLATDLADVRRYFLGDGKKGYGSNGAVGDANYVSTVPTRNKSPRSGR